MGLANGHDLAADPIRARGHVYGIGGHGADDQTYKSHLLITDPSWPRGQNYETC